MKLNKLTIRTFLGLTGVAGLIGGLGTAHLVNKVEKNYIEIQAAANAQQATRVAGILEQELAGGISVNDVVRRLQESLVQNPFDNAGFLCLMSKGGKVLCHPDPNQVGMEMPIPPLENLPGDQNGIAAQNLSQVKAQVGLLRHQTFGGSTHILYQQPVTGTDWSVAVHANFDLIRERVAHLRNTMLKALIPTLIGIVLLGTLVARLLERRYEQRIERANAELEGQVAERTSELEKTSVRYRNVFEGAASAIFLIDESGRIIEANRHAEDITGWPQSTLRGRPFQEMCAKLSKEPMHCRVAFDQMNQQCVWEAKLKTAGATQRDVLVYESSVQEGDHTIVQAIVLDMTEKKQLEADLRQAQKLDSIGQLAGGIAHDFNNLLCAIGGYANLAQEVLLNGRCLECSEIPCSKAKAYLSEVLKSSQRASNLTGQLLAFGRKQRLERRVINLNDTINGIGKMLRRIIGERIQIRTELCPDPDLWPVLADAAQLDQVILNLAVNARDAMPEGGTLTISTRNQPPTEKSRFRDGEPRSSGSVVLGVADTGGGIPEEIKDRIFEPFFTTKEQGKGTGLGLAVVHGIIKQHQGEIELTSRLRHGTTFRITLPRANAECVLPDDNASDALHRGTETLLVVEDDPAVRTLVEVLLSQLGYKILTAENADQALALLDSGGERIDMVLTDMIMPGLDVREFTNRLARTKPNLKVAYMTGYTDETDFLRSLSQRGATVLRKPFSSASLSEAIRRILDAEPALSESSLR